jgi:hypothetical protein
VRFIDFPPKYIFVFGHKGAPGRAPRGERPAPAQEKRSPGTEESKKARGIILKKELFFDKNIT